MTGVFLIRLQRIDSPEVPEIGTADAGPNDLDNDVIWGLDSWLVNVDQLHLALLGKYSRFHKKVPFL